MSDVVIGGGMNHISDMVHAVMNPRTGDVDKVMWILGRVKSNSSSSIFSILFTLFRGRGGAPTRCMSSPQPVPVWR
eukprot:15911997-Heterocapsa_arctica.AAC.1